MRSSVLKRSIVIAGHKTSVSLEDEFWDSLKEIAGQRGTTLAALVAAIDGDREHANLSSAIRLFVLGVCVSSEHFGQLAWQFKRMSGSSGLKVRLRLPADAGGVFARWFFV